MLPPGDGICYSGYREGQSPDARIYPSMEQIREDLQLLGPHWRLLRLYDCSLHAERVLEVIRRDRLDFSVLLGGWLAAETSNPGCPWGGVYDDDRLAANAVENDEEMERLVSLAGRYDDIVCAVAVGNEATVDWTDHLVPVERVIGHVRRVRRAVAQPVTVCENHVPWQHKLRDLVPELDFISLHSYPVWEYRGVEGALEHTRADCERTRHANPGKPIVITEAGWTTGSNGRGIEPWNASEAAQERYCTELRAWSNAEGVTTFVFEAFDEPWKGSPDPLEPEKHWGFYTVDRRPKQVMRGWLGAGTAHGIPVAPGCGGATRTDRGLD
ncbi:MAG: glycosyl hydrolase family 17 protein [Steroidobacteraceae bacterium]